MWKSWIYLLVAGFFEILFALSLPRTESFTKLVPTLVTVCVMGMSLYCLSRSLRELPIGTAYAVWTGIGAAGTAGFGMLVAGEPGGAWRVLCIALILLGTVGLKLTHG